MESREETIETSIIDKMPFMDTRINFSNDDETRESNCRYDN